MDYNRFTDIFTTAVNNAYEQEKAFLEKLALVQHTCNENVHGMHIECRVVTPEHLDVKYIGSPKGVLAQGNLAVGLSKRQDGTTLMHIPYVEDKIGADEGVDEILDNVLHGIANQEAIGAAYKLVAAQVA